MSEHNVNIARFFGLYSIVRDIISVRDHCECDKHLIYLLILIHVHVYASWVIVSNTLNVKQILKICLIEQYIYISKSPRGVIRKYIDKSILYLNRTVHILWKQTCDILSLLVYYDVNLYY